MSLHTSKQQKSHSLQNKKKHKNQTYNFMLQPILIKHPYESKWEKYIRLSEKTIHKYIQFSMKCTEMTPTSRIYTSQIAGVPTTLKICLHFQNEKYIEPSQKAFCKIFIENSLYNTESHFVLLEETTSTTKKLYKKIKEYLIDFEYEILDHFPEDTFVSDEEYTVGEYLSNEEIW